MTAKIIILGLILIVVVAWFALSEQPTESNGKPPSPVLVDILQPQNGRPIALGETVPVLAQAWSPAPISVIELWVDGESVQQQTVDTESQPLQIGWDWMATDAGVHSLVVVAEDSNGERGQSQSVLVNVSVNAVSHPVDEAGQTLEEISGQFGVPLDELLESNPLLDPEQELGEGQPIILPPSNSDGADSPDHLGDLIGPELLIEWQFMPTADVDRSYCYQTSTDGMWRRAPADPFTFLPGDSWLQTVLLPAQPSTFDISMECWGWQGETLTYLGEGQTSLDFDQDISTLTIIAQGFEANGSPIYKPLEGEPPGGNPQVPAPFALREPQSVAECAAHYGNVWATAVCAGLMNIQIKQYYVLEWEWQPAFCWPNSECAWANEIDGYYIYELGSQQSTFLKNIANSQQRVTAVALPWGSKCYAVQAYADTPAQRVVSDYATYCPGEPPAPQQILVAPQDWLTTDGEWLKAGCSNYGDAPYFTPSGTQLSVGVYQIAKPDCLRQGDTSAAVKFQLPLLGSGVVIQQARLLFSTADLYYVVDSEVATNEQPLCVRRLGKATQDWTALSSGHFLQGANALASSAFYVPYSSGFTYNSGGQLSADVTSLVLQWVGNPASNHGVILSSDWSHLLNTHVFESGWDQSVCYSLLDNVQLEILYFTPPN